MVRDDHDPAGRPADLYLGLNAGHSWRIIAGLEVKGNDPDSGWTAIPVTR